MPTVHVAGVDLAYIRAGNGSPVLLLSGLSGNGRGWGQQIDRFADDFDVIVPDHPGTGDSGLPERFTLSHHARSMAELLGHLDCGPAHIVGSSTGGAIAQLLALEHSHVVRSISLVSSWARADDFFRHQFAVRKEVLRQLGPASYARVSALFLFSPAFFREHYSEVERWLETATMGNGDVMEARIDMILEHDELDRLGQIDTPTLVLVGSTDVCTPPHLSRELAAAIPGAESVVVEGGHLIYKEAVDEFHRIVSGFIRRH